METELKELFLHQIAYRADHVYHVTRCALKQGEDIVAQGISVCSWKDQYKRRLGNEIAKGRAYKALNLKQNYNPLSRRLQEVMGNAGLCLTHMGNYQGS